MKQTLLYYIRPPGLMLDIPGIEHGRIFHFWKTSISVWLCFVFFWFFKHKFLVLLDVYTDLFPTHSCFVPLYAMHYWTFIPLSYRCLFVIPTDLTPQFHRDISKSPFPISCLFVLLLSHDTSQGWIFLSYLTWITAHDIGRWYKTGR